MADREDIPREFYSEYSGEPFHQCIDCERTLFDAEIPYSVMKHIVGREAVFEMAICFECAERMREEYSEETRQNIQQHMESSMRRKLEASVDQQYSYQQLLEFSAEKGLVDCVLCGKPRSESRRYEIIGLFLQDQILVQPSYGVGFCFPMMVCEDCIAEVAPLISKKTRDAWDRFVEEHFDGPPGVEVDSPKFEPILF